MDIWTECKEGISISTVSGEIIRVVESQELVATRQLVDSLQEQELLEQLLDDTKPGSSAKHLHYLLQTPFRYPPLKHGSRFGTRQQPGLFYGSYLVNTALAETAYYRLLFWQGMQTPPPSGKFTTQHTVFAAAYRSRAGLKLQLPPFDQYQQHISHPASYVASQLLGSQMRENGIEVFEYISARDRDRGANIALFSAKALAKSRPLYQQFWLCETETDQVSFLRAGDGRVYQYPLDDFLLDSKLPAPAL